MSTTPKRLTDAQVASGYLRAPGAPSAKSLRSDHDQAREDRKKVAVALRARLDACCPPTVEEPCRTCMADLRLLKEVDAR